MCEDKETGEMIECESKRIWMTPDGISLWWGLIFSMGFLNTLFYRGVRSAIMRLIDLQFTGSAGGCDATPMFRATCDEFFKYNLIPEYELMGRYHGILYGSGLILTVVNHFAGNNGSIVHLVFHRFVQLSSLLTIGSVATSFNMFLAVKDCDDLVAPESTYNKACFTTTYDNKYRPYALFLTITTAVYHVTVLYLTNDSMTEHFESFAVKVCSDEDGEEIECPEESEASASTCFDAFGEEVDCSELSDAEDEICTDVFGQEIDCPQEADASEETC